MNDAAKCAAKVFWTLWRSNSAEQWACNTTVRSGQLAMSATKEQKVLRFPEFWFVSARLSETF